MTRTCFWFMEPEFAAVGGFEGIEVGGIDGLGRIRDG